MSFTFSSAVYILLSVLTYFLIVGVISYRTSIIYKNLDVFLSQRDLFPIILTTFGIQNLIPFPGTHWAGRSLILKKFHDIEYHKTILASSFEVVCNFFMYTLSFVIALQTSLLYVTHSKLTKAPLLVYLGLIVIGGVLGTRKIFIEWIEKFFLGSNFQKVLFFFKQITFNFYSIVALILLSAFVSFLNGLWIWLDVKIFSVDLTFIQCFSIFWIPFFLGKISKIPLGLGVSDISMIFMLKYYGVFSSTAIHIVLFYRIFFSAITIFLALYFIFKKNYYLIFRKG